MKPPCQPSCVRARLWLPRGIPQGIRKIAIGLGTICPLFALSMFAQGTFQNLGFESANVVGLVPGYAPITNTLPGWQGYLGGNQTDLGFYDTVSLGAAAISLHDSASLRRPIAGSYSVFLQSSVGVQPITAAIAQTGQIPSTAMSLQFYGVTQMQVTFSGQLLTLFQLGSGPNYQIVGADISGFAGQTGELRFTMPKLIPASSSASFLDNIQFSTQIVPEPSALGICSLGALLFGWRLRHRSKV